MRHSLPHPQRQVEGSLDWTGQPASHMQATDLTPRSPPQVCQQQPAVRRLDRVCRPLPRAAGARAGVAALARADCAAPRSRTGASTTIEVSLRSLLSQNYDTHHALSAASIPEAAHGMQCCATGMSSCRLRCLHSPSCLHVGQVQQAMRDARSNGFTRRASSSSEPATPSAAATANGSGGGGGAPLLAEGAETALLYVRFRAAAEPGLKGAHRLGGINACI